jgi:ribonucleoside-diphosphate reductase alpha chain
MGFADVLIMMDIRYGTKECLRLIDQVMGRIEAKAMEASRAIGESRGSFPNWAGSGSKRLRRNATLLSIAPTGTISIIAGCSSGIEPHYAFHLERHVLEGEELHETDPQFLHALAQHGLDAGKVLSALKGRTSVQELEILPEDMRRIFVSAHDVHPLDQVRVQAAFQEHVDNAVSKTINLRMDASIADVAEAFTLAHGLGCKGLTVYREGSKAGQVLTASGHQECPACGRLGELANHVQH